MDQVTPDTGAGSASVTADLARGRKGPRIRAAPPGEAAEARGAALVPREKKRFSRLH